MGERNYLVEGVSGTGKTTVCDVLQSRGFHAVHGDRELAYQGDPETGDPTDTSSHEHHLWDVDLVRRMACDRSRPATFFCGGSRNHGVFLDVFDEVFVLEVDRATLVHRLARRQPGEWGAAPSERELVLHLHSTREDVPADAVVVDATRSADAVVDEILRRVGL